MDVFLAALAWQRRHKATDQPDESQTIKNDNMELRQSKENKLPFGRIPTLRQKLNKGIYLLNEW